MGDNKSAQQPDVNEQIKVRMEKLKNLQDAGKDPFQITKYDVTHHTDEIRAIYEAHEKELLGDRPAVNTEGLDEQQAREAVTADYNERRAIMDASPINVRAECRHIFQEMQLAKKHMQTSRSLISVISSVSRDLSSELRQERFQFTLRRLLFFLRAYRYFQKSSTESQILI